jgi:hypothetical protein
MKYNSLIDKTLRANPVEIKSTEQVCPAAYWLAGLLAGRLVFVIEIEFSPCLIGMVGYISILS